MDDDLDAMDAPDSGRSSAGMGRTLVVPLAVLGVLAVAVIAARSLLGPKPGEPGGPGDGSPEAVIAEGRLLFESRCSSCHGNSGRGDGPIASSLQGPGPGDLTDDDWKHGDRPDQVVAVIAKGIPGTTMSGWESAFDEDQIRSLASYMYHLAGRDIPEELLSPPPPAD